MQRDDFMERLDRLGSRSRSPEIPTVFVSKVRGRRWVRRAGRAGAAAAVLIVAVSMALILRTPSSGGSRGLGPSRGYGVRPNIDPNAVGGITPHASDRTFRVVDGYRIRDSEL